MKVEEVSPMPFRAILLFLLVAGTTSTAPLDHFQLPFLGASVPGANKISTNEQSTNQENNGPKKSQPTRKHTKHEAQPQTLTGTVEWEYKPLAWDCEVPNCDHFALYDDATQVNYELDDARVALPFEGKRASVTGVVNAKDSIIHVLSIEAVK
jgi:hypothetical protein